MLDSRLPEEVLKSRKAKIAALKQALAEYLEQKKIISQSTDSIINTFTPEDIEKHAQKLFALKLTGKTIKKIFDQSNQNVSNLRDSENKFKPKQQDIEQFNQALQTKDSVYAQFSLAPEKLSTDISVEPIKKREGENGWVSYIVDKFYWFVGKRSTKGNDGSLDDNKNEENTLEQSDKLQDHTKNRPPLGGKGQSINFV
jgi:hypothetical protein